MKAGRQAGKLGMVSINLVWKIQFLLHIIKSPRVLAGTLLGAQPSLSACHHLLMPHSSASLKDRNNRATNSPIFKVCIKELSNSCLASQTINRSPNAQT